MLSKFLEVIKMSILNQGHNNDWYSNVSAITLFT